MEKVNSQYKYQFVHHVDEFVDDVIERRQHEKAAEMGFKLTEHSLIMYGRCNRENCPNKKAKS